MDSARELGAAELYTPCDPERLGFARSDEVEPLREVLGQPRALAALELGVGVAREGYNLFVLGPSGTDRHEVARRFLAERARDEATGSDWCYVQNFGDPRRPTLLQLPPGTGSRLHEDMERLVEELRTALAEALESEEYQTRRQMIDQELGERQSGALERVGRMAEERGLRLIQSPAGILFVPVRDGEVVRPDEIQKLPPEERERLEREVEGLQQELQKSLRQAPRWHRERREAVRELDRQVTRYAAGHRIEDLRGRYRDQPRVLAYLEALERDVVDNARAFAGRGEGREGGGGGGLSALVAGPDDDHGFLRRYGVNVLVERDEDEGAPVVYEDNPTHANLIGRIEHRPQMGALVTDFHLIRAGALHRANGGYLVLDALEVLRQPFAWQSLKRALRAGRVRVESPGEAYGLMHTVSLEPEPAPLAVKAVLVGEPWIYYMLCALDPDFRELFKVAAEFDDRYSRGDGGEQRYAAFVADLARADGLRPVEASGVARAVEHAARLVGDSEKLSLDVERIRDVLREADHWASREGRETVGRDDVQRALDERRFRTSRLDERLREEMVRGTLAVPIDGEAVGQVNGLSVVSLGDVAFGRPQRITARVRLGSGEVVDIEREVELSGPLHSKGVLILAGFLGQRYAGDLPLSLAASLVFEQSYAGVEGDSASSAELYALLSAIARTPLRQSLAVTGSVDQHGRVQAVGGVNEKIEAFFDLCQARELTGEQGVLIPAANAVHLMLRGDVVEAVSTGRFHIWAVESVDQGIELLTGLPAGAPAEDASYPEGSFNRRVQERLAELARRRRSFVGGGSEPSAA